MAMPDDRASSTIPAQHRRLRHLSATGKFTDAAIFSIFAGLGIGTEVVTHLLSGSAVLIIAGPVCILLLYVVFIVSLRRFRLRYDQVGDNCYYLGFLFTLTALSIALYDFQAHSNEIGTVVSNFGVALASTIVGVLLRVMLSQMREDPIEVEEESRYELAQASAALKNELFASVREMSNFRGLLQQSIFESFDELNERSKEVILQGASELSAAASRINEQISERNEELSAQFDQFNTLTQRSVRSLEALVESLENMRAPGDAITEAFSTSALAIQNLSAEIVNSHQLAREHWEHVYSAIESASESLARFEAQLEAMSSDSGAFRTVDSELRTIGQETGRFIERVRGQVSLLGNTIKAHEDTIEAYKSATEGAAELIEEHNTELAAGLERNRAMLQEVERNLAEMARALARAVG